MLIKLMKERSGGIVLEAALILPFFLAFVMGLVVCVQLALLEMALNVGVSEATKTIAGQIYPVRLLVQEAAEKWNQSSAASAIQSAIDKVEAARNGVTSAESLADDYAAYIPDAVLELVRWEKEKRESGEAALQGEWDEFVDEQVKSRMLAAFTPIVYGFCNEAVVDKASFQVTDVQLPSLTQDGNANFVIEAQLTYRLPIPFMSRTVILRKRAMERTWIGASG
ncbi:pilus assembly protein [Paenibacillus oryzisoli]|uniref:TadE/TadG family type IV pilus assembly protein n=1 Tax=Paenibacillus oryzisoli TaxID=1850517 RepID=UPI003D2A844C